MSEKEKIDYKEQHKQYKKILLGVYMVLLVVLWSVALYKVHQESVVYDDSVKLPRVASKTKAIASAYR